MNELRDVVERVRPYVMFAIENEAGIPSNKYYLIFNRVIAETIIQIESNEAYRNDEIMRYGRTSPEYVAAAITARIMLELEDIDRKIERG